MWSRQKIKIIIHIYSNFERYECKKSSRTNKIPQPCFKTWWLEYSCLEVSCYTQTGCCWHQINSTGSKKKPSFFLQKYALLHLFGENVSNCSRITSPNTPQSFAASRGRLQKDQKFWVSSITVNWAQPLWMSNGDKQWWSLKKLDNHPITSGWTYTS